MREVITGCQAIVLVTDHDTIVKELYEMNLKQLGIKIVIDGRNVLNKSKCVEGLVYRGIGVR
jgi:UDP-N-acetyl-D-mannosaminuronate dehydrogenase